MTRLTISSHHFSSLCAASSGGWRGKIDTGKRIVGSWTTALAQAGSDPIISVGLERLKPSLGDAVVILPPDELATLQSVRRPLDQRFDHFRQYQFFRIGRPALEVIHDHYLKNDSNHSSAPSAIGDRYDRLRRKCWVIDFHRLPKLTSHLLSLVLEKSNKSHDVLNYLEGLALRLEADAKIFERYPIKNDPSKRALPVNDLFEALWKFLHDVREAIGSQTFDHLAQVEESYQSLSPLLSAMDSSP